MTDPNHHPATNAPQPTPELEAEQGDLPNGWVETTLGEVVEVLDSRRIPINADERNNRIVGKPVNQLYPYFGATGQVGYIDDFIFDEEIVLLGEDGVPFYDLLKKKAYLVTGKSWVNNHAHVLKGEDGVTINKFLVAYLNAFNYEGFVTGTTRLKLTQAAMNSIPFPLPPLLEQIRIADKLDALLARVEAGRERLARMPALLARLRQSILSAAVSGELTRDWRGGRDAEWEEVKLETVLESLRNGVSAKPDEDSLGRPILKISSVRPFRVTTEEGRFVPQTEEEFERFGLRVGDLLVTRYNGTIELVGVAGMVRSSELEKFTYPDKLMRLRLSDDAISGFVEIVLNSPIIRVIVEAQAKTTSGQTGISGKDLKSLPIPLPPLTEQAEIVRRVESLFARVDALERQYSAALRAYDLLTPALLQKAFRGELVPQDPNDEPASVLLERIRAQRAANGDKPKRGRGAGRKKAAGAAATAADEGTAAPKRRGRPRKVVAEAGAEARGPQRASIPTATSYEDAVRQLEAMGGERATGQRQPSLFGDEQGKMDNEH